MTFIGTGYEKLPMLIFNFSHFIILALGYKITSSIGTTAQLAPAGTTESAATTKVATYTTAPLSKEDGELLSVPNGGEINKFPLFCFLKVEKMFLKGEFRELALLWDRKCQNVR